MSHNPHHNQTQREYPQAKTTDMSQLEKAGSPSLQELLGRCTSNFHLLPTVELLEAIHSQYGIRSVLYPYIRRRFYLIDKEKLDKKFI